MGDLTVPAMPGELATGFAGSITEFMWAVRLREAVIFFGSFLKDRPCTQFLTSTEH
jgi:hypothetical protein